MIRGIIGALLARLNPLAAKHKRAVHLQETYGSWPRLFFDQLTADQVRKAGVDARLAEAASLFRAVITEGEGRMPPGAMAVTKHQLAYLLHRQGRLQEAADLYQEVLASCRLYAEPTETCDWALCFALFRLAEVTIATDRAQATAFFRESKAIAERRRYRDGIKMNAEAIEHFGLCG
jgi:hypothetical protein